MTSTDRINYGLRPFFSLLANRRYGRDVRIILIIYLRVEYERSCRMNLGHTYKGALSFGPNLWW